MVNTKKLLKALIKPNNENYCSAVEREKLVELLLFGCICGVIRVEYMPIEALWTEFANWMESRAVVGIAIAAFS